MAILRTHSQVRVAIFTLLGRVFMPPVDCPFQAANRVLDALPPDVRVVLLDFHAEATSDKQLMGRHLDGRVTAVLGTHTHVPTADEQILPGGTAFQCDVGMTGPHESILGRRIDRVMETTRTFRPTHFEVATGDVRICGNPGGIRSRDGPGGRDPADLRRPGGGRAAGRPGKPRSGPQPTRRLTDGLPLRLPILQTFFGKSLLHGGGLSEYLPPAFHWISVAETSTSRTVLLSGRYRLGLTLLAIGLAALLGVARALQPNPQGRGTHQQLGLPPCTFVALFGRPCPTCGMTTSWAWLMRGHVVAALRSNASGALLGMLALAGVPWLLVSAARGRWLPGTPGPEVTAGMAVALVAIALIQWGWRLLAG